MLALESYLPWRCEDVFSQKQMKKQSFPKMPNHSSSLSPLILHPMLCYVMLCPIYNSSIIKPGLPTAVQPEVINRQQSSGLQRKSFSNEASFHQMIKIKPFLYKHTQNLKSDFNRSQHIFMTFADCVFTRRPPVLFSVGAMVL